VLIYWIEYNILWITSREKIFKGEKRKAEGTGHKLKEIIRCWNIVKNGLDMVRIVVILYIVAKK